MKNLYRFLFIVVWITILSNSLSAQVSYGLKVGLNLADIRSNATFPDAPDFKYIPSLHIGLLFGFNLSERLSLQPELLLSRLGGEQEVSVLGVQTKLKQVLSYVTIPLLLEYKLGALSIEAGPGIGYLLDSSTYNNGKKILTGVQLFDEKIDVDLNAGIKYSFNKIFTQLRWKYSLLPIAEIPFTDVNGEPVEPASFYNTAIQISLGYKF